MPTFSTILWKIAFMGTDAPEKRCEDNPPGSNPVSSARTWRRKTIGKLFVC